LPDIVDAATRSRMMSGIRGKDTRPEMFIRSALHRRGFRYRLHARGLPGRPDMVFPSRRAVVFVHGCFWHGHDCRFFRLPGTRREFWQAKLNGNRQRDVKVRSQLSVDGWRQLVIWECALRGQPEKMREKVADRAAAWLRSSKRNGQIRGS
jgi:DNA mismatch endonuclease (patch repair protein)